MTPDDAAWALRPATLADVPAIAEAERELFPEEAWSVEQIAGEVGHHDRRYVIAAAGEDASGPLLGYAGIMLAGETADLHTIGTLRPGRGIGRALLAWCEDQAYRAGAGTLLLEVREDNRRARAVYDRAGYREMGRRRGYYRLPGRTVDAIVMARELDAGRSGGPSPA